MKYNHAIKLSIHSLEKERKLHAFNANLYKLGVVSESTTLSIKEYEKLTNAINALKQVILPHL